MSFAFNGNVSFMPEFLTGLSTSDKYAVILIQQSCQIPGNLIGTRLVQTKFGRKYTVITGVVLCGGFNLLFIIFDELVAVINYLDYYYYKFNVWMLFMWIQCLFHSCF